MKTINCIISVIIRLWNDFRYFEPREECNPMRLRFKKRLDSFKKIKDLSGFDITEEPVSSNKYIYLNKIKKEINYN